jgi:hypothetical protein
MPSQCFSRSEQCAGIFRCSYLVGQHGSGLLSAVDISDARTVWDRMIVAVMICEFVCETVSVACIHRREAALA